MLTRRSRIATAGTGLGYGGGNSPRGAGERCRRLVRCPASAARRRHRLGLARVIVRLWQNHESYLRGLSPLGWEPQWWILPPNEYGLKLVASMADDAADDDDD